MNRGKNRRKEKVVLILDCGWGEVSTFVSDWMALDFSWCSFVIPVYDETSLIFYFLSDLLTFILMNYTILTSGREGKWSEDSKRCQVNQCWKNIGEQQNFGRVSEPSFWDSRWGNDYARCCSTSSCGERYNFYPGNSGNYNMKFFIKINIGLKTAVCAIP